MASARLERRPGLDAVELLTVLHQRIERHRHGAGLYQAAEFQFWWSVPRSTDTFPQLFWLDDEGAPVAAAFTVDFGDGTSLVYQSPVAVIVTLPDVLDSWRSEVLEAGLRHVAEHGIERIEVEVDRTDDAMLSLLAERGFERSDDGLIECWLDAAARPPVSDLHDGYRLFSRADLPDEPHHLVNEQRPDVADRLADTSLYRPDLDLAVLADDGSLAGYGLFWFDPTTSTGVVEPMRTHEPHRGRGLARHILTEGIDRLATAGAAQISIGYEPGNPASGPLYRSVGFRAGFQTDVWSGPTGSDG